MENEREGETRVETSVSGKNIRKNKFQTTIEVLNDCAQACNACMTDCLQEEDVKMLAECIRLNRDCADICALTSEYLSRESAVAPALAKLCVVVCDTCAKECEKHSHMEHCKQCAEVCRKCAEECRKVSGGR